MNILIWVWRVVRTLLLALLIVLASAVEVRALSAGFLEGNFASLTINGLGFFIIALLVVATLFQMMSETTMTRRGG